MGAARGDSHTQDKCQHVPARTELCVITCDGGLRITRSRTASAMLTCGGTSWPSAAKCCLAFSIGPVNHCTWFTHKQHWVWLLHAVQYFNIYEDRTVHMTAGTLLASHANQEGCSNSWLCCRSTSQLSI